MHRSDENIQFEKSVSPTMETVNKIQMNFSCSNKSLDGGKFSFQTRGNLLKIAAINSRAKRMDFPKLQLFLAHNQFIAKFFSRHISRLVHCLFSAFKLIR